jgi:ubiquinone biosynthesis protein Coq4
MLMAHNSTNSLHKTPKSVHIMKDLPYENYLTEKRIHLPHLKKVPRDKKVLLDIEKVN